MKNHLLAIACVISAAPAFAQSKKFTFKMGSEYGLPRKTEDLAFLGNEKDGIINLSLNKDELTIFRFDAKSLNQSSEKVIALQKATKNFVSEKVIEVNNNYYWLHSDWDKESEMEYLYYDKVDVRNGKIEVANKKMLETTKIAGESNRWGEFPSFKAAEKYRFNFDAAEKKLLVSYRLKPENKNEKANYDKIGLCIFDDQMNKLWGGEFTMPYTEAIMDNSDFSVDAEGNAYLLAKVYDSDSRREKDKTTGAPAYHYEVLKFTKNSKKIVIASIAMDEYFIMESSLVENSMHEMIIACTYTKKAKGRGTDGILLAMLGQNGKIAKYKKGYYEFPLEELQKFESARSRRKLGNNKDSEMPNIKVRNIIIESDGGVFIACEEFYIQVNEYMSQNGASMTTKITRQYCYEDMLAVKINSLGNLEWLRKLPKRQWGGGGRGTMSFKLVSDASGYYFLYLDNIKNLNLSETEVPKYHVDGFGGQVIVSAINQAGRVSKELLFDTREEDIMIFPADFDLINSNQFIGRARLKKNMFEPLMITIN